MVEEIKKKHPFLSREQISFFKEYFEDNQKSNQISYELFLDGLYGCKFIIKDGLESVLKDIKAQLDKKNYYQNKTIYLKFDEYFKYIEIIFKEQELNENQNDPEMRVLFENLSKGQDYLYKKNLISILQVFELPLNLDEFFAPLNGQEEISFNEFCTLFRTGSGIDDNIIRTFYSTFCGFGDVNINENSIKAAHFPLNYVPHNIEA